MSALLEALRELAEAGTLPALLGHAFMVRALVAGLLLAPLLGLLGPLVLTRRLAFFSAALGHAALTGVALGVLLGAAPADTQPTVLALCLTVALGVTFVRRRGHLSGDAVVGVFLSFTLGLGICLLALATRRFDIHQVEGVMFGNVLTVSDADLLLVLGVAAVTLVLLLPRYNRLLLASVDPSLARVHGAPTGRDEYLLAVLLTLVVVASLKMIGFLLVEGLVVVPAAAARNVSRSLRGWVLGSIALALLCTELGTLASYRYPVPTGAAITLVLAAAFLGTFLWGLVGSPRARGTAAGILALGLAAGAAAHPLDTHFDQLRGPVRARLEAALEDDPEMLSRMRTQGFRPFRLDTGDEGFLLLPDWDAPRLVVLARRRAQRVPLPPEEARTTLEVHLSPGSEPGTVTARLRHRLELAEGPRRSVWILAPPDAGSLDAASPSPGATWKRVHRDGVFRAAVPGGAAALQATHVRELRLDEPGPYWLLPQLLIPLAPGSRGDAAVTLRVDPGVPAVPFGMAAREPGRWLWGGAPWVRRPAVGFLLAPGASPDQEEARVPAPPGIPSGAVTAAGRRVTWIPSGAVTAAGRRVTWIREGAPAEEAEAIRAHARAHQELDPALTGPLPDGVLEALVAVEARRALREAGRREVAALLDATLARALLGEPAPPEVALPVLPGRAGHERSGRFGHPTLQPVPVDAVLSASLVLLARDHGAAAVLRVGRDVAGRPLRVGELRTAVAATLGPEAARSLPDRAMPITPVERLRALADALREGHREGSPPLSGAR